MTTNTIPAPITIPSLLLDFFAANSDDTRDDAAFALIDHLNTLDTISDTDLALLIRSANCDDFLYDTLYDFTH